MRVIERRPATRCSFCHGDLSGELRRCAGCGTTTHAGCFDDQTCPTLGCAGVAVVAAAPRARRRFSWLRVALTVGALVAPLALLVAQRSVTDCRGPTPERRALSRLLLLRCAMESFEADHRRQPRRLEQLVERTDHGPYVEGSALRDPWDRPFGLVRGAGGRLEPICWGADGLPGGEGDDADLTLPRR